MSRLQFVIKIYLFVCIYCITVCVYRQIPSSHDEVCLGGMTISYHCILTNQNEFDIHKGNRRIRLYFRGMILNKYANSTVLPIHRTTPILFFNSDEKSTIRHITHTPNRHHIATYLDKSFVSTSSNVPDLYSLVNISLKISTKAISATGIFSK